MTGKDMASQLSALKPKLKDQSPQKDPEQKRPINEIAWEFDWRRRLNLCFDDAKLLAEVKEIAKSAGQKSSSTQVNHLAQMGVKAATWSEILNYLNKQMSKTDPKVIKNRDWMSQLQEFLVSMEVKGREVTKAALQAANRLQEDSYEHHLRNQEAALILYRGMLERFAGYSLYFQAAGKGKHHGKS